MYSADSLQAEIDALRAQNNELKRKNEWQEHEISTLKEMYKKKCDLVEVISKILAIS